MSKQFTFTRPASLEGMGDNKSVERELKRAAKLFNRGDPVPESIWFTANAMLTDRARALSFTSKRPYFECSREVLRRDPHLRLGVTAYMPDKYFSAIEFVEERSNDTEPTD